MKKVEEKTEKEIVNVIDEFDYSTQQESYNKSFIAWRKNKNNPLAYNFVLNKKESVFIDGQGFIDESVAEAEGNVLSKLIYTIGIAMMLFIITDNVFGKLLVQLLSSIGFDIHNNFIGSIIYGGSTEIVIVLVIIGLLKYIVPMIYLSAKIKMPWKLKFPSSLNNHSELLGMIAAALIVSAVLGIPSAYSNETKEIYTFFKSCNADVSVWGQREFVIYTIFDVIIVSVLFEALFRGEMFSALRQFGDEYAIVVTSVLSGLLSQNYQVMFGTMLISLVASIGALRSGTIFSSISVQIIYKMYMLALAIIEVDTSDNMFLTRNMFMLCMFCSGVLLFIFVYFLKKRKNHKFIAKYQDHIALPKKIAVTFKVLPFSAAIAICIFAATLRLFI